MSRSIEWIHDGRRIVLPVQILKPGLESGFDGWSGHALVDTGATTSAITPRVARALGLQRLGKRPLGSAQGEGQAERYVFRLALPTISDGAPSFPFVFDRVQGFELAEAFSLDALIGMDILSQCDFTMRRDRRCILEFG
jgi:predicted aspartyl protease